MTFVVRLGQWPDWTQNLGLLGPTDSNILMHTLLALVLRVVATN